MVGLIGGHFLKLPQARRFIPGGSPIVPTGEHRTDPKYRGLFRIGDALAFQVRSPGVASTMKGRTTRTGSGCSSHKLLPPPRRAGVDHKPSATAAPPGGHLAESNLAMVTIADELCGHE